MRAASCSASGSPPARSREPWPRASGERRSRKMLSKSYRLCVLHPIDPRGSKIGGIETHIRQILAYSPTDFSILLVGLDGFGDLTPGKPIRLEHGGQPFDFLPVVHYPEERIHEAAKKLHRSVTLRFTLGALRYLPAIRRLMASSRGSADLHRFELALIPRLLGLP